MKISTKELTEPGIKKALRKFFPESFEDLEE
jgi:hypothetical protein